MEEPSHTAAEMSASSHGVRGCLAVLIPVLGLACGLCQAQDLAPRAYLITPVHGNAVTVTYSFYDGSLEFGGGVPITGATATANVPIITYYHSFSFFGRSANFTGSLGYGVGNFEGKVTDAEKNAYRSGLLDSAFRISVNLKGGPAMPASEFVKWKQKTIIGVSLRVVAPSGQYDPTKLVNWGNNRWAFKPEIGFSQRWGHWLVDGYGGAWFYTTNPEFFSHNQFFSGSQSQSQNPIGSFEGHLSYDFSGRRWVSLDGNFWFGGKTSLNGVQNPVSLQRSSRIGATGSLPVTKHQSLKASFSLAAYAQYGGNFKVVSAAWQYSWLGRPFKKGE